MADKPDAAADTKIDPIKPKDPIIVPAKTYTELRLSEFIFKINDQGSFILIASDPFNPLTKEVEEKLRVSVAVENVLVGAETDLLLAELIKCIYVYAEQKLKEQGAA